MHGKVVVVDQEQFRTGGRNLWDRSFGIGKGGHLDTDILVKGPSAKNAQEYFDSLWESEYSAAWKLTGYRKRYGKNPLEKLYVKDGFKKEAFESALNSDDLKPIEKIEFIGDTPKAPKLLAAREREILMGSTREAFIETPWLVPTRVFQDIVEKARKKLVDLRILTNSPESAEYPFRGFISRFFSSPLINAFPGIVAEIRGKLGSHAKTTTVDGTKTLVSSYNFGPRSEGINLEAGVLVESAELASEVQEEFKRRSKDATKMMPYRKSLKFFCSESLAKVSRDLY